MVGIDILDVDGATHPLTGVQVHILVGNACLTREGPIRAMRVSHQEHR
jgi:hypothetical protein